MIKKNLSNLRSLQYVIVFFFLLLGSTLLIPLAFSCDSCNELFSLNVSKGVCPSSLYDALNSEIGDEIEELIASRGVMLDYENSLILRGILKEIVIVPITCENIPDCLRYNQDESETSDCLVYLKQREEEMLFIAKIPQKDKMDNLKINVIYPDEQTLSLPLLPLMIKMICPLGISLNLEKDEGEGNSGFNQKINPSDIWSYMCYYLAYQAIINFVDCLAGYNWDCSSAVSYALLYYLFCT